MRATFDCQDNPARGGTAPARIALTCSEFAVQKLGFTPDEKQRQILDSDAKQGLLNCCRQFGKSTVMAAKALHHALHHPNCTVIIASPSARQSREMMRKCKDFARFLRMKARGDGDNRISLLLPNGSRIVGLPGRADTVRSFAASLILVGRSGLGEGRNVSGSEPDAGDNEWGDVDAEYAERVARDVLADVEGRRPGLGTV